jgi:hypothetical protein
VPTRMIGPRYMYGAKASKLSGTFPSNRIPNDCA